VSRDIFIQDLPVLAKTVAEIPKDFKPRSMTLSNRGTPGGEPERGVR
jgi:hypothetical protein